jgi:glycosyltransferase involved in cell wall biosynthesis
MCLLNSPFDLGSEITFLGVTGRIVMKLLYIVPSIGVTSETFVSDLLNGLAEGIDAVDVVCGDYCSKPQPRQYQGLRIRQAPFLALTRPVDRVRIRIVKKAVWSGDAARATVYDGQARRVLEPILLELRPDVALIEYGSTLARCAPIFAAQRIPICVHLHGRDVAAAFMNGHYRDALARGLDCASKVIVASRHMARLAVIAGAAEERVRLIRYGVELDGVEPEPWRLRLARPPSAVFLGRMVPKKNPVALIEAFRLVAHQRPDARLHMIGDGPELKHAQARAATHGLGDLVKFHGAMRRSDALKIVRAQRVYVQHSVTAFDGDQEGFGLSLAEAAAMTLPIVSTSHNGIPEQVIDGETGFLVPEYDFEEMARRILQLFGDIELCKRLGNAGRLRILEFCKASRRVEQIVEVLMQTAKPSGFDRIADDRSLNL